ncbi:hypothetical protein EV175_001192 [Coemansia sp. RSA 1933]|nr:hypothetical protein EV175_001192 [Coemansia sp. RSA 1933]
MPPNARVKIQGLYGLPKARTPVTPAVLEMVAGFFRRHEGRVLALTGAGVSVPSGIPDYRGTSGTYRVHGSYRPILHHELVSQHGSRQRYWARSFFGIRPAFKADPNEIHYSFAKLETLGYLSGLVTQNVDGLHSKAGSTSVLELHGTLMNVRCLSCAHEEDRDVFQKKLELLNPSWVEFYNTLVNSDKQPARRPDGDVDLPPNLSYEDFVYPACETCGVGHFMPTVVFFGGNVADSVRLQSYEMVDAASALFVCGTSLATFSAYRLVKRARDQGKDVLIANYGETRGDGDATTKLEAPAEELLPPVAGSLEPRSGISTSALAS